MDVNNINPNVNNLQALNPQSNLERLAPSASVENKEEDSYNLNISSLLKHDRSNLALGLQEANSGLAISKITQKTLEKNENILDKIETKLETSLNNEDISEIKSLISDFSTNTDNSKFENKKVFAADYEDNVINLSLENNSLQVNKADLKEVTENLITQANNLPGQQNEFKAVLNSAKEVITDYSSEFKELENKIKDVAKESLVSEQKTREIKSTVQEINFATEAKDFTKTNINSNIGLIAAQANIVQEQSVRLLSK